MADGCANEPPSVRQGIEGRVWPSPPPGRDQPGLELADPPADERPDGGDRQDRRAYKKPGSPGHFGGLRVGHQPRQWPVYQR